MTRINVELVENLCDEHLRGECYELPRIPNDLVSGRLSYAKVPAYTLGEGHQKFFVDKLLWLRKRYLELIAECHRRGFKAEDLWNKQVGPHNPFFARWWHDYEPTPEALDINRDRLIDMFPDNPHYWGKKINQSIAGFVRCQ